MAEGIQTLTVYAFSTENWNRTPLEIDTLMSIFAKYTDTLLKEAIQNNVRIKILSTGLVVIPSFNVYELLCLCLSLFRSQTTTEANPGKYDTVGEYDIKLSWLHFKCCCLLWWPRRDRRRLRPSGGGCFVRKERHQ